MTTVTDEDAIMTLDAWAADPAHFFREVMGTPIYAKQREIAEAVRDHPAVAVVGCNGSGKDYIAGRIMVWWQNSRVGAKTIVLGPTHRQVRDILWAEARHSYLQSKTALGGYMTPVDARYTLDDQHKAQGFSPDNPLNITGWHAENLLVIVTEAHAVKQIDIEYMKLLQPRRLLLTGNALTTAGEFFMAFHEKTDIYHGVHISAYDTPNLIARREVVPGMITEELIEQRRRDWGEDSPLYRASVLGEFPDDLEDAVVSRRAVQDAIKRRFDPEVQVGRRKLSCDVARFGDDNTVVYFHHGKISRMAWKTTGNDTMAVTGRLVRLAKEYKTDDLIIDDVGVGGGVTDRLRELKKGGHADLARVRIVAFNGGKVARDSDDFVNAITEAWLVTARRFKDGELDIDDNPALVSQLSSRKKIITSSGKLQLEPKKQYKERGGRSPDDADAFCMGQAPEPPTPSVRWIDV